MVTAGARNIDQALRVFRALGDETRLRLIDALRPGEQCVCDLGETLGAAQSLLSFHLRTLKEAGLVRDRREGRWVYYALNPDALDVVERLIEAMRPSPAAPGRPARRCD